MNEENSKIPSWLRDTKKRLIIVIVIICALASNVNAMHLITSRGGESDINYSQLFSNVKNEVSYVGGIREGYYTNESSYEGFYFDGKGYVGYYYGDYAAEGTYEVSSDNYLILNLEGVEYRFHIDEKSDDMLIISNEASIYIFTRVED